MTARNRRDTAPWEQRNPGTIAMLDVVLLALGLVFFVVSVGYAYACERL